MSSELDIWRTAQVLVTQYGDDAPAQAAERARIFRKAGHTDAAAAFKRMELAAEELLRDTPDIDDPVH
jgi:hypothetical protein